jgi:asparagine synthetase B (glutamine-hydrolysing)
LSRRIKSMGVKMVLSGEGSDEVFGGELMSEGELEGWRADAEQGA